jgi:hypothetical protein
LNEIVKANRDIIPFEQLKSFGLNLNGYLSDERSIYHLRKIIAVHDELSLIYQLTQEHRLLPLVERLRREVSGKVKYSPSSE